MALSSAPASDDSVDLETALPGPIRRYFETANEVSLIRRQLCSQKMDS